MFFTIPFLIWEFFNWLPYTWLVGGIIGIFVLWFVTKWARHMAGIRNSLDKELTQASHGAALILLAPLITRAAFVNRWVDLLPHDWILGVWPATLLLMGLGAFWLIVCSARTRTNFRDAQLISRAVVKIAVGCAVGWATFKGILPPRTWPYWQYLYLPLVWLSLFCIITGIVKFVLLMRGPPGGNQRRVPGDLPNAGFGSGEGFR